MRRMVDPDRLYAVFEAADALLGARESDMLSAQEWNDLDRAVAACYEPPPDERDESFAIENNNTLVRRVVPLPGRGEPYEHRCSIDTYTSVAHAIDEMGGEPFVMEDLKRITGMPWTQVSVAVAFLRERGCVRPSAGRAHAAATNGVYEDAMIEWHALREGAPGSA